MTIGTAGNRVSLNCDGATKVFPVNLQAYLAGDFTVILTASAAAGGGQTTLVLNSDYSLATSSTDAPPKWTLTTLGANAYLAGYSLQAFVNPSQVQQTSYVQGQAFPSLAVQTNLDRLTQMVQRVEDQVSRSLAAPDGDVSPQMLLPTAALRKGGALIFDTLGNPAIGVPVTGTISTATLAPFLNLGQTGAEAAAGITPTNLQFAPGNVLRYGTNTVPGTTNMTVAIQAAMSQAGQTNGAPVYVPAGTYLTNAQITLLSNTTVQLAQGAIITCNAEVSIFFAVTASNIQISGGQMQYTALGVTNYIAGVKLVNCTNCIVQNVIFNQMKNHGVYLLSSNNCTITGNYFSNFFAAFGQALQDQCDICLNSTVAGGALTGAVSPAGGPCNYNNIAGNFCYGGGQHGILIQDPYTLTAGFLCFFNKVHANKVGAHFGHGIAIYMPSVVSATVYDCCCDVYDNDIENISAGINNVSPNLGQGNGIYVVGAGTGGTQVHDNIVRNCCLGTTQASLGAAGIVISTTGTSTALTTTAALLINATTATLTANWGGESNNYIVTFTETVGGLTELRNVNFTNGSTAISWFQGLSAACTTALSVQTPNSKSIRVRGNIVSEMSQWNGIVLVGCQGQTILESNTVNMPVANAASGNPGTPLFVHNCSNTLVIGNTIMQQAVIASRGIFVYQDTLGQFNVSLINNQVVGGGTNMIEVNSTATTWVLNGGVISGNICTGGNGTGMLLANLQGVTVCNNVVSTIGAIACATSGLTTCTFDGNYFNATTALTTGGVNSNAFFSASNIFSGLITNSVTGSQVIRRASGSPATGTAQAGDVALSTTGTNVQWNCTVAGSPGTWVSH